MPTRVSSDEMMVAAEWLDFYDPDAPEFAQVRRVADWLREQAEKRDKEASVRALAREHKVTPATVRRALKSVETAT